MNDILIKHHISHNITSWIYEPLNLKQFNQSSSLFPPSLGNTKAIQILEFFFKSHPRLTRYHVQHQDKCLLNSKGELPFEKKDCTSFAFWVKRSLKSWNLMWYEEVLLKLFWDSVERQFVSQGLISCKPCNLTFILAMKMF